MRNFIYNKKISEHENSIVWVPIWTPNYKMKILDIGCGDGKTITKLFPTEQIWGLDLDQKCLNEAQERKIIVSYASSDKTFPYNSNFFDIVYSNHNIEHIVNTDKCLQEVHRVLKDDGTFYLNCPNLAWWINRIALLMGFQPYLTETSTHLQFGKFLNLEKTCAGHLRAFTPRALKKLLEYYGFKIVKMQGGLHREIKIEARK